MENQIETMLRKGVILVPKKNLDGKPKYRFCVDFRTLNALTQFETYPLPVFEENVSTLHGSKYFSVIGCYSGFWQIKIAEEDKMKTAFSTPSGHYHFHRLKQSGRFSEADGCGFKGLNRDRMLDFSG